MSHITLLSKREGVGVVYKCPDGVVHMSCGFVTLHMHEQTFIDFALMVKEAFSAMAAQSLKGLLEDPPPAPS